MRVNVLCLVLLLTACATQTDRQQQMAAWHQCINEASQAHAWLSDCS